ncbi:SinI family restriction endonuclease [Collinsella tanakaei]|uniref:SinI family restriction endonuclease n=1 Tax=Collinsella tanakaei TaxID=626935 RepID=UPI002942C815|nr:SinI family restriction endonuclease [Collinsella tanakaei]
MAKNANKNLVKIKLRNSLNYCNSHHIPAQQLFEDLVDEMVTPASCLYDYDLRAKEMKSLFPVLLNSETEAIIPSIPLKEPLLDLEAEEFLKVWMGKWIAKFLVEWKSLPSDHEADPKKTVTDRALINMVMSTCHAGGLERAEEWAAHHNLYMSAENVGGNLLEEYIASKTSSYGWIWCRGKILTAIDFCNFDCTSMFQVKNKTNTENSSGKGFREACGARVWCRMRAELRNGTIETYWDDLISIIKSGAAPGLNVPDDLMSENEYLDFVKDVAERNPNIITEREGNFI